MDDIFKLDQKILHTHLDGSVDDLVGDAADTVANVLRVVMTIFAIIWLIVLAYYRSVLVKYADQGKYLEE